MFSDSEREKGIDGTRRPVNIGFQMKIGWIKCYFVHALGFDLPMLESLLGGAVSSEVLRQVTQKYTMEKFSEFIKAAGGEEARSVVRSGGVWKCSSSMIDRDTGDTIMRVEANQNPGESIYLVSHLTGYPERRFSLLDEKAWLETFNPFWLLACEAEPIMGTLTKNCKTVIQGPYPRTREHWETDAKRAKLDNCMLYWTLKASHFEGEISVRGEDTLLIEIRCHRQRWADTRRNQPCIRVRIHRSPDGIAEFFWGVRRMPLFCAHIQMALIEALNHYPQKHCHGGYLGFGAHRNWKMDDGEWPDREKYNESRRNEIYSRRETALPLIHQYPLGPDVRRDGK
jgi:hypothetical protein